MGQFLLAASGAVLAGCWLAPVTVGWRTAPDLGHAWAVPLLMAYLWWERWSERPPVIPNRRLNVAWWLLLAALAAVDLPLRLLLAPFPLWPMPLLCHTALFAGIAILGGWLFAGRPGVKWISGPLLLLISTLPMPSYLENTIIIPLRQIWASLSAEISNLVGLPALAYGTSVRLGNGWVGIDEACGGIRSLQACVMIALFFGEWYRFSLWRRLVLLVAAIAAALLGNFGRVLFLSLRANAGAHAVESAHDLAGWIAMGASLVLTGWLACRWAGYRWPESWSRGVATAPQAPAPPSGAGSPLRRVGPAAIWLAALALILVGVEGATRAWFAHGRAVRRASVPQWTAALPVKHWSFRSGPLTEPARELLRPDTFLAGSWRTDSNLAVSGYYIEWKRGQVARSIPFLHNPTVCLPLAGCELESSLAPIDVSWSGGSIPFFAYKFHRMGEEILVAFTIWDPSRGRLLEKPDSYRSWAEWWSAQWAEVREARRDQPGQLLAVTLPWTENAPDMMRLVLMQLIEPKNS
ncbi:MAG TPA: exosortase/archaeosortase family protein [Opitutus sp.]|nr:exosortase/archaeosortase family protein [Opitutus sp.]